MIRVSWKMASVIAGRVMWCQPLAVISPELHQPICTTCPRPKLGNQPSVTENTRISKIPIRKVGSDTPSSEIVMNSWLVNVPPLQRRIHAHRNAHNQGEARNALPPEPAQA